MMCKEDAYQFQGYSGFGNPCSHTISSSMFALLISQNVINDKSQNNPFCLKFFIVILAVLWVLLTSLNCIILGSNSLDQIIFGLSTGLLITSIITFILNKQKRISRHFQKLIRGRHGEFFNQQEVLPTLKLIFYCVISGLTLYLAVFFIVQSYLKNNE